MDKINNTNLNKTAQSNLNKGNSPMPDRDEIIKKLTNMAVSYLKDVSERAVPENGKFTNSFVTIELPESQNIALISIEPSAKEPKTQRILLVGVRNKYSDRIFSNYMFTGTKKEVLDYIDGGKNNSEIIESINTLSKKADDFYSSL